jgi:hypothetical protein
MTVEHDGFGDPAFCTGCMKYVYESDDSGPCPVCFPETGADAQEFEARWWGNCANTYGEETKQHAYAAVLGLDLRDRGGPGPTINLSGASILDLGGGPTSLLLKTENRGQVSTVVDPLPVPDWVKARYEAEGIAYLQRAAEGFSDGVRYDEVWIYNVLQHVYDPVEVLKTAARHADYIRIFEWVDVPAHEGHPHELKAAQLDKWLGASGNVLGMNHHGASGKAYVYTGAI